MDPFNPQFPGQPGQAPPDKQPPPPAQAESADISGLGDVAEAGVEVGSAAVDVAGGVADVADVAGSALEGVGGCLGGCAGCSLAILVGLFLTAGSAMAAVRLVP